MEKNLVTLVKYPALDRRLNYLETIIMIESFTVLSQELYT